MPFKIPVIDQLGKNVLHKCGNGAWVKSKFVLKGLYKMLGQNHVSDTEWRGDGLWEGIQVNDVVILRKHKECFGRLCGNRKFRFKIVLDDISASIFGPSNIFVALGCACCNTTGIATIGGCMQNISTCFSKSFAVDAGACQRKRFVYNFCCLIYLLNLFIGWGLNGIYFVSSS